MALLVALPLCCPAAPLPHFCSCACPLGVLSCRQRLRVLLEHNYLESALDTPTLGFLLHHTEDLTRLVLPLIGRWAGRPAAAAGGGGLLVRRCFAVLL